MVDTHAADGALTRPSDGMARSAATAPAQPELAVETLRRAFAADLPFGVELHALPELSPLAERRDFREILRPRG